MDQRVDAYEGKLDRDRQRLRDMYMLVQQRKRELAELKQRVAQQDWDLVLAQVGPGECFSPRHRMPFDSTNEGL